MKTKPTTYAFIDSQNLNLGVESLGWTLDFKKFRKFLSDKYHVKSAFLFIGFMEQYSQLYTHLQEYGYILVFKPVVSVKTHKKISVKGNVDAELVLHAMVQYPNYDQAIIVSGDGDFFCLVEYLDNQGKLLKIISPSHTYSSLLRKYAPKVVKIAPLKAKLELQKREK